MYSGVENLPKVSVTSSGLDSEDTALNVEERHIEGTSAQVINQDVTLLVGLASTETVSDSGSGGLVDDTEDVEASDGTGVLGGLPLVVVEVGGDGDDGLLDLLGELGLGNLLHLWAIVRSCPIPYRIDFLRTLTRIMAEISWGEKVFSSPRYSTETLGLPLSSTTLKGQDSMSFLTVGSSNLRPIRRLEWLSEIVPICALPSFTTHLTSKTVLMGFMAAWFLAASPIRRSSAVKETKEGVVKEPWSLATGEDIVSALSLGLLDLISHTDLNAIALVVGNARVGGA